ncbi:hypothetical protein LY78DRAFT_448604 [Colletotrichum sublineola]|nr:hypothetical protein LY78DRAFT_448604 [Colletotrichum sublineola]
MLAWLKTSDAKRFPASESPCDWCKGVFALAYLAPLSQSASYPSRPPSPPSSYSPPNQGEGAAAGLFKCSEAQASIFWVGLVRKRRHGKTQDGRRQDRQQMTCRSWRHVRDIS